MNTLPKHDASICLVHAFCNYQAIKILKNDTNTYVADIVKDFLGTINRGNSWSDQGFKNIHHFYNPKSKKGILGLTGADTELINYFDQALDAYKKKATSNFFFYIGAVLHIIQDMCVPQHVFGRLLHGHREYEDWVVNHYMDYGIDAGAQYDFIGHIGGDDFVLITDMDSVDGLCSYIIDLFDKGILSYYSPADADNGYIVCNDRQGKLSKIPIMSISIAVIENKNNYKNHLEISEKAAELKKYAKSLAGSVYVKERRQH